MLAAEKRITSSLILPSSVEKIIEVDSHVGMALSGVSADTRLIMDHARLEAAVPFMPLFDDRITPLYMKSQFPWKALLSPLVIWPCDSEKALMAKRLSWYNFGPFLRFQSRPFGVSILIAGIDAKKGPILYHTDPSGTYLEFDAKAIGAGSEAAMITLESSYKKVCN